MHLIDFKLYLPPVYLMQMLLLLKTLWRLPGPTDTHNLTQKRLLPVVRSACSWSTPPNFDHLPVFHDTMRTTFTRGELSGWEDKGDKGSLQFCYIFFLSYSCLKLFFIWVLIFVNIFNFQGIILFFLLIIFSALIL